MSAWAAFRDGLRRVHAAPLALCALVLVTLLVTAIVSPPAGEGRPAAGHHAVWLRTQATHVETMSTPSIAWFAAALRHGVAPATGAPPSRPILLATITWLVLWPLLAGGVLDRYARGARGGFDGFLKACGTYAWPLLRLAALAGAAWLVLAGTVPLVAGAADSTRGDTLARAVRAAAAVLVAALAAAAAVVFDYARVRIVVEDRLSAIGALAAAIRFAARRAGAVAGLAALHVLLLLATISACNALSAGTERADMHGWLRLALGQTCIVAHLYLTLLVYASAVALVQGTTTIAGGAAEPDFVWPDSPEAEPLAGGEVTSAR